MNPIHKLHMVRKKYLLLSIINLPPVSFIGETPGSIIMREKQNFILSTLSTLRIILCLSHALQLPFFVLKRPKYSGFFFLWRCPSPLIILVALLYTSLSSIISFLRCDPIWTHYSKCGHIIDLYRNNMAIFSIPFLITPNQESALHLIKLYTMTQRSLSWFVTDSSESIINSLETV